MRIYRWTFVSILLLSLAACTSTVTSTASMPQYDTVAQHNDWTQSDCWGTPVPRWDGMMQYGPNSLEANERHDGDHRCRI